MENLNKLIEDVRKFPLVEMDTLKRFKQDLKQCKTIHVTATTQFKNVTFCVTKKEAWDTWRQYEGFDYVMTDGTMSIW